jgi:hypothetical protein
MTRLAERRPAVRPLLLASGMLNAALALVKLPHTLPFAPSLYDAAGSEAYDPAAARAALLTLVLGTTRRQ